MAQGVPVAPTEPGSLEAVDAGLVPLGPLAQLRREHERFDALLLRKGTESTIRIEEILRADPTPMAFAQLAIRMDLNRVAQRQEQESRIVRPHLVVHLADHAFRDAPGRAPGRVVGLQVDPIVEPGLEPCALGLARRRFDQAFDASSEMPQQLEEAGAIQQSVPEIASPARPSPEIRRLHVGFVQDEGPLPVIHMIGSVRVPQGPGVVPEVVARQEGQHDPVRIVDEAEASQRQQLLGRPVAAPAQVDHLHRATPERGTLTEAPLGHRREGLLPLDLEGVGIGVPDDDDAQRVLRLRDLVVDVARALGVQLHPGPGLAHGPALGLRDAPLPQAGRRPIEGRIGDLREAQQPFDQQQPEQQRQRGRRCPSQSRTHTRADRKRLPPSPASSSTPAVSIAMEPGSGTRLGSQASPTPSPSVSSWAIEQKPSTPH